MEINSLQIIVDLKGFSGTGQPCLHRTRAKERQRKRSRTPKVSSPSREPFSLQRQSTWVFDLQSCSQQMGGHFKSVVPWVLLKPVGKPPWVLAETELGQQENNLENLS